MRPLALVLAGCFNLLQVVRCQELSVIRHSDGDIFTTEGKCRIPNRDRRVSTILILLSNIILIRENARPALEISVSSHRTRARALAAAAR